MNTATSRGSLINRPRSAGIYWLLPPLAVSVWWLSRPYLGFGHDALYYAADVLRRVGDDALNSDLFFGRGTQGEFSVYPWLYAALVRRVGISDSAFALTLVGRLFWLASLANLCRAIYKGERATLAFAVLLLLPAYYDSHRIFSYGEPFETPRHWAECAAMLGMAAALRKRFVASFLVTGWACAIHPLMGLPGMAVVVVLMPSRARRAVVASGVIAFALLLLLRAGPAAQLFHTYDDAWYGIVLWRNPYVLVSEWDVDVLARVATWVFLLGAVAFWAPVGSTARRAARAVAWTTGLFLVAWVIGCIFKNVLIIQLQLWRVLWIAQLTAPALLLALIPSKAAWRPSDRAFVALLAAALLSDVWTCLPLALLAVACRSGLPRVIDRLPPSSLQWIERSAYALFVIVSTSRLARIGFNGIAYDVMMSNPHSTIVAIVMEPAATGIVAAVLICADSRLFLSRYLTVRTIAIILPLAALAFWIYQADEMRRLEHPDWVTPLKRELPAGKTVYWDAGPEAIWMLLGRASYASFAQGAGVLFSRPPAIELDHRLRRLEALRFIPDRRVAKGLMPAEPTQVITLTDVEALCRDPPLDLVVLNGRKEGATQLFTQGSQSISIFRCADFRTPSSGAA